MVTKNYCDICKKEIARVGEIIEIKITPNRLDLCSREEICEGCSEKIKNFINSMRIK
jgi:hypothetical protein